jgi:hypothetical protein
VETQHFRKSRSWFRFKFDWFLWLFAALFAFLFISLQMSAQGGQAHAKAADQGALVQDSKFADKSSQNEQAEEPQNPKNRKRRIPEGIIFAPIPISSPAIGSGVVLAGGYIFPFRKADRVSPPSTVAGAAVITDNGTRGLVLAGEFYLKENL